MKNLYILITSVLFFQGLSLNATCISQSEAKFLLQEELVINTDEEVYQDLSEIEIQVLVESLGFNEEMTFYETSEFIRHRECLYSLEIQCDGHISPRKRACLVIRYDF